MDFDFPDLLLGTGHFLWQLTYMYFGYAGYQREKHINANRLYEFLTVKGVAFSRKVLMSLCRLSIHCTDRSSDLHRGAMLHTGEAQYENLPGQISR